MSNSGSNSALNTADDNPMVARSKIAKYRRPTDPELTFKKSTWYILVSMSYITIQLRGRFLL